MSLCMYASVWTPSSAIQRFVSNGDIEILFMHIPYISGPSLLKIFILCINCFLPIYLLFYHIFCTPLFFVIYFFGFLDRVHLRPYHQRFSYRLSSKLVFHLAQRLFVHFTVQEVVFRIVADAIQPRGFLHVAVHVFHLDLQRAGYPCLCRSTRTYPHTWPSLGCSRSRTSRPCCSRGSSCQCVQACSVPAEFCVCGCWPCRLSLFRTCQKSG